MRLLCQPLNRNTNQLSWAINYSGPSRELASFGQNWTMDNNFLALGGILKMIHQALEQLIGDAGAPISFLTHVSLYPAAGKCLFTDPSYYSHLRGNQSLCEKYITHSLWKLCFPIYLSTKHLKGCSKL